MSGDLLSETTPKAGPARRRPMVPCPGPAQPAAMADQEERAQALPR